jgi:hypothetical protein
MSFGLAMGVVAAGGLSPASASAAGGMQTVEYDGYSVTVPASWQVFHLDTDPGQCVRYDINAVYLGVSQSAAAQGGLVQSPPPSIAGRRIAASSSPFSQLNDYSQAHELRASVAGTSLSVTATYGADSGPVTDYLRSIHRAGTTSPEGTTSPKNSTSPPSTSGASSSTNSTEAAAAPATTAAPASTSTLTSTVKASIPSSPLNGFDACTAPSVNAMKAWKSKYSAIGVYIGGQNMACDYGNLSASWVRSVHGMGWSLLPIYVGLQAPCNSFQDISTKTPAAQGTQAAVTAVGDAAGFGLGKGSPIYFDMESYNNSNASCKNTVLQFLSAWTQEIHAKGYVSGVYSSASTGVSDLVAGTVNGHAVSRPDALWFALWDKHNNLTGTPYLPASRWAGDRVKQYQGNQNVKVGGYSLNIDGDRVGGAVSPP